MSSVTRAFSKAFPLAFLLSACGAVPPARPAPVAQPRPLAGLLEAATYPNADPLLLLTAMQQLTATHQEWQGYALFGRLAEEQPNRRAFFRSLQAIMQARVAGDVPLLRRIAWVDDAVRKLDEGAAADPKLGRLARGLVFADLPPRFGKARQAVADLEAVREASFDVPLGIDRGIYRALAAAYHTLGDEGRSQQMLARAGLASLNDGADAGILGDVSVDGARGFRFGVKRLAREADGVYVAEGYDFANIAFIVAPGFVVAIDAGTTEETAREALAALRGVTAAPIKYIVLTHAHWDHVGGLGALREPGSVVIARDNFPSELARARSYPPTFQYFFGTGTMRLDAKPDRLISKPETIDEGGLDLVVMPAPSGETDDALFVQDRRHGLLFVGDAFMPFVGAPAVPEGSTEGYLAAIAKVQELQPRRLIHGHIPLTAIYTIEAMPGLGEALGALYARGIADARAARPLAEALHDNFMPPSLRAAPAAAQPYLITRDTFLQRLYLAHAGYWQPTGDGVDPPPRAEWAGALDMLGGGGDGAFVRTARELETRGDAALALRIAEAGLLRHPDSAPLQAARQRALTTLRGINSQTNPFRFIIYSEWAGRPLPPLPATAPTAPPRLISGR
jgi:glyoxylase-like metal-dependent hydrolase (beta-lactamase superfamily II)